MKGELVVTISLWKHKKVYQNKFYHLVDDPADDERDVVRERHVGEAAGQQRQQRRTALHGLL